MPALPNVRATVGRSAASCAGFRGLSYIKENSALDLTSAFHGASGSVRDKSKVGGNKDAVLYTGHYVMTDGAQGYFYADISSAPEIVSGRLRARMRSGSLWVQLSDSPTGYTSLAPVNSEGVADWSVIEQDVWKEYELGDLTTGGDGGGGQTDVRLGFRSHGSSDAYYEGDWSDLRLFDANGNTVAHYWFNSSTDINASGLAGLPCPDSSGNGYHGTYTLGCNGEGGEGMDADVARIEGLDDEIWFNGVDAYRESVIVPTSINNNTITGTIYTGSDISRTQAVWASDETGARLWMSGGTWRLGLSTNTSVAVLPNTRYEVVMVTGTAEVTSLTLNGVEVFSGSAPWSTANSSFKMGARGEPAGLFYEGLITDVTIGGTEQIGTPSGEDLTVGQKRETIIQTAGMNWNKYSWFNGVDTVVTLDSGVVLSGDFDISFTALRPSTSSGIALGYSSMANPFIEFNSASRIDLRFDDGTASNLSFNSSITANVFYDIRIERASGLITLYLDNVAQSDTEINSATLSLDVIGQRFGSTGDLFNGIILNININNQAACTGLGNDPWKDTIGSNDGTESGTFERILVPESDASNQIDAYGTAILNPRPNAYAMNFWGETDYIQLADDATLESVRSITLAIFNDGSAKDILIDAATASFVDIASDTLQTDQAGTHAYYVNGVATTALANGWNIVGITFDAGKDLSNGQILATSGSLLGYDPTALTATDHLTNYDAFSSKYGI